MSTEKKLLCGSEGMAVINKRRKVLYGDEAENPSAFHCCVSEENPLVSCSNYDIWDACDFANRLHDNRAK